MSSDNVKDIVKVLNIYIRLYIISLLHIKIIPRLQMHGISVIMALHKYVSLLILSANILILLP